MPLIQSKLPPIYHRFFPDFQSWQVPQEEIATCPDCVMCRKPNSAFINTKCCTYYPKLPNYLIGGILQDNRASLAEGKRIVKEQISNKNGIIPFGSVEPAQYRHNSQKILKKKESKRTQSEAESMLCPYYDRGNCSIWDYRENCCSTHFCFSVGGDFGQNFWRKLNNYLKFVEYELAKFALLQLNFPIAKIDIYKKTIEDYAIEDKTGKFYQNAYDDLWGNWAGKEEELFLKSYEIVSSLSNDEFIKIGGINQQIFQEQINHYYTQFIRPEIPEILIINPKAKVIKINNHFREYKTEMGNVIIPLLLEKFILLFNGESSTTEICQKLQVFNLNFEDDYLRKLYQLKILIPPNQ